MSCVLQCVLGRGCSDDIVAPLAQITPLAPRRGRRGLVGRKALTLSRLAVFDPRTGRQTGTLPNSTMEN
jgi:hypothetical protein